MAGKSILISGYFGFDNGGDEAVLSAVVRMLRRELPDADLVALSADPERTAEVNRAYGLRAINRKSVAEIKAELAQARLFISGGGSLFQDVTSVRSVYYYASMLNLAHKAGVPAIVLAQGLGPLNTWLGQRLTVKAMAKCELLSWRDQESLELAASLGLPREKMLLTCDPVLNWIVPDAEAEHEIDHKTVVFAIRPWKHLALPEIKTAVAALTRRGVNITLLPFHKGVDEELAAEINAELTEPARIVPYESAERLFDTIAAADYLVGMRLHSLIMARAAGTPCGAISYDPKIDSFAKREQIPVIGSAAVICSEQIVAAYEKGVNAPLAAADYSGYWQEPLERIKEIYHRA